MPILKTSFYNIAKRVQASPEPLSVKSASMTPPGELKHDKGVGLLDFPLILPKVGEYYVKHLDEPVFSFCLHKERYLQKLLSEFSTNSEVAQIEKKLAEKQVFVRFKNNKAMANLVQGSLARVEQTGFAPLPDEIFILPAWRYSLRGHNIFRTDKKAWVFISERTLTGAYPKGYSASDTPASTIFHEIGHCLHYHNLTRDYRFVDADIMNKIFRGLTLFWQSADTKLIEDKVSLAAGKNLEEFVTEIFTGIMDGKQYSSDIMSLYKNLRGPMPKKPIAKESSWSLIA